MSTPHPQLAWQRPSPSEPAPAPRRPNSPCGLPPRRTPSQGLPPLCAETPSQALGDQDPASSLCGQTLSLSLALSFLLSESSPSGGPCLGPSGAERRGGRPALAGGQGTIRLHRFASLSVTRKRGGGGAPCLESSTAWQHPVSGGHLSPRSATERSSCGQSGPHRRSAPLTSASSRAPRSPAGPCHTAASGAALPSTEKPFQAQRLAQQGRIPRAPPSPEREHPGDVPRPQAHRF